MTGVMVEAFNIIQDRISRARLAGDPPDMSLQPRLGHIGLSEFHRAGEAIEHRLRGDQGADRRSDSACRPFWPSSQSRYQATAASMMRNCTRAIAVPVVARQRSGDMDRRPRFLNRKSPSAVSRRGRRSPGCGRRSSDRRSARIWPVPTARASASRWRGSTKTGATWPEPNGPAFSSASSRSCVAPSAASAASIFRLSSSLQAEDLGRRPLLEEGPQRAELRALDGDARRHARGRRP